MTDSVAERKILDRLEHLERDIDLIKERLVDDAVLGDDDKHAVDDALDAETAGKLLGKDAVFE